MNQPPVTIDGTFWTHVQATATGARYRLLVAEPTGPRPAAGFPVIYLLDAAHSFGTLVDAVRLRCRRPDATGIGPAIVVGLVPDVDATDYRARRTFDYTAWAGPESDPHAAGLVTGGAPGFLAFLEAQVVAQIAARFVIDVRRQVLIGHSLAGFFALWALTAGAPFTAYVAISPSIWWNPEALTAAIDAYGAARSPIERRVLITVGEYEQRRAPWQPDGGVTDDALRRRVDRRMVDHARAVAMRIAAARCGPVDYHLFEGEDHASVVTLSLARALRFALPISEGTPTWS